MDRLNKSSTPIFSRTALASLILLTLSPLHAANKLNLSLSNQATTFTGLNHIQETSRHLTKQNMLHVRVQQTYKGLPVYGADAVLHIANGAKFKKMALNDLLRSKAKMNGTFYQQLDRDLQATPTYVFGPEQAQQALAVALKSYQQTDATKKATISQQKSQLLVYVDDGGKAHYAYRISFLAEPDGDEMPTNPTYILDAASFKTYLEWNDLAAAMHADPTPPPFPLVDGGGIGGNVKSGQLIYDGSHNPSFKVSRDPTTQTCYFQNTLARVKGARPVNPTNVFSSYPCPKTDPSHNNVYWAGAPDTVNGGYSATVDGMANGDLVRRMFSQWYKADPVAMNGKSIMLSMIVHYAMNSATYSNGVLSMGDGMYSGRGVGYFPFSTRDIMAHEMSYGFTAQHSALSYIGQAGGINESFGDMTAKAVELYATGSNSWMYGADVVEDKNSAIRYFDQPSKDCLGVMKRPACSVDNMSQYRPNMDSHQSAAFFNRVFYLWATSSGWSPKKVYDVMLLANTHYWTSNTSFNEAAFGALAAASELGYPTEAGLAAFGTVGVEVSSVSS